MTSKKEDIEIGKLYNEYLEKGYPVIKHSDGYEVIDVSKDNVNVHTIGNIFMPIKFLSRHKTGKHLIEIASKSGRKITVTTDHVCMRYNRDHFLEETNAKNLSVNDSILVYVDDKNSEYIDDIESITDLGSTDEYVYDLEIDESNHCFYGNDILVHNSQFVNLQCVTDSIKNRLGIKEDYFQDWSDENKQVVWDEMEEFVNNEVNKYVRDMIHNFCHTNQQNVLTYELEYMGDVGVYESKKHYAVHKCFDEGEKVDKIKFSGIELKKASVPKEMKKFLSEIYHHVLLDKWTESDYEKYINELYDKFQKFSIDEVAFWKGYNTERQATGFLQMALGSTGIASACTYHNHLLQKLGIGKKYEEIRLGDKVRFTYVEPGNQFKINYIAYKPGQWPTEFNDLFKVDYKVMFNKLILDSLKKFREACKFRDTDPSKQIVQDIFSF